MEDLHDKDENDQLQTQPMQTLDLGVISPSGWRPTVSLCLQSLC